MLQPGFTKALFVLIAGIITGIAVSGQELKKDVPYVPTPQVVVDEMLKLASVTDKDVVYDLGSGDGRIVITAAKKYGARGVGVDIDPERVKEANANALLAGVTGRVKFIEQDLFQTDLKDASVVTLYLLPAVNIKLRPKLWRELKPGTRVVSHRFDMGDWKPEKTVEIEGSKIYYWTIPAKASKN
jgi:tRNA G37 N-methylase Trm5